MRTKTNQKIETVKSRSHANRGAAKQSPASLWQKVDELISHVPEKEWGKLPKDGSEQVDHYLYGSPKR